MSARYYNQPGETIRTPALPQEWSQFGKKA